MKKFILKAVMTVVISLSIFFLSFVCEKIDFRDEGTHGFIEGTGHGFTEGNHGIALDEGSHGYFLDSENPGHG